MICIIPVGEIEQSNLFDLKPKLKEVFGLEVEIKEGLDKPDYAYNPERKQYFSTSILKEIAKTSYKDCERVLGVVDLDLFVPSLNFIFGEADIWGKSCIISVSRLHQSFYGLPEDQELFQQRVLKEAVHELGHTFGLSHCPDPKCVMHFSNSLKDTDIKSHNFCKNCKNLLKEQKKFKE
ncbi:MAG: hypothetical protein AMJ90_01190 [candidate division Zixibacteria bacterium SM23_73_2]|nr:MAG: hypothetical protein AMJ90_01190 [candidate division Zixibacteria bacterium SM23_73_2]